MLTNAIQSFTLSTALAQGSDYKALVCIFTGGGNDGNNTIVPIDSGGPTGGYDAYASVRGRIGGASPGLGIPLNQLQPISTSIGNFGLHPSLGSGFMGSPSLHALYNQTPSRVAVVCNAGPLVFPMNRDDYRQNRVQKPYQLFSHSDQVQQWQTSRSDRREVTGWGGRIADRFSVGSFPMVTSISGVPLFSIGAQTRPLSMNTGALNQVFTLSGFGTAADEQNRLAWFNYFRSIDRGQRLVVATSDITEQAMAIRGLLSGSDPVINTPFPNTSIGNQLKQVAKVIKANQDVLHLNRQIFFTSFGGFDTHQNQVNSQANLLTQLSQALGSFYAATVELGVSDSVTTFTLSDFSRTFAAAGSGGSVGTDHAWGNNHFVVGGVVRGGDLYGKMHASTDTVMPLLQPGGPDDTDTRGRWIPQVSVEQYAATLASWYGVSAADLQLVFPLLSRFSPANLGFLT
jgi:uncharacterized protein (DUF1501 family)